MNKPIHPAKDPAWQARKRRNPKLVPELYDAIMGEIEASFAHQAAATNALTAEERERVERELIQFEAAFARELEEQIRNHGLHVQRMGHRRDLNDGRGEHFLIWIDDREGRQYEVRITLDEANSVVALNGANGGGRLLDLAVQRVLTAREKYFARMQ
jgi:hypothetical protein